MVELVLVEGPLNKLKKRNMFVITSVLICNCLYLIQFAQQFYLKSELRSCFVFFQVPFVFQSDESKCLYDSGIRCPIILEKPAAVLCLCHRLVSAWEKHSCYCVIKIFIYPTVPISHPTCTALALLWFTFKGHFYFTFNTIKDFM